MTHLSISRILLVIFFSAIPVFAIAATDLKTVLFEMETQEKNLDSVQFRFDQTVNFIGTGIKEKSDGSAVFKKPNKMKVIKDHPAQQEVISNGRKMWIYNPQFNQVWVGGAKDWATATNLPKGILPISNYVSDLKQYFDLSLSTGRGKNVDEIVLVATPKDPSLGYQLTLVMSTESWVPSETRYHSETADIATQLSEFKPNPVLKESDFNFTPPHGTDIIPFN